VHLIHGSTTTAARRNVPSGCSNGELVMLLHMIPYLRPLRGVNSVVFIVIFYSRNVNRSGSRRLLSKVLRRDNCGDLSTN
jgi:hypothetical protein